MRNRVDAIAIFVAQMLVNTLLGVVPGWAGESKPASFSEVNGDPEELQELLSILEEETNIATQTKMNADFVPGIVTVLHGDDLENLGIRNVWEALGMVSGIDVVPNNFGELVTIVRGMGLNNHSGNLQVQLDSVPLTSPITGQSHILEIPVAQVVRIEVIRGPGSALYGGHAYSGVVNVITRGGKRFHVGMERFDTKQIGGVWDWKDVERDFKIRVNLAARDSDGSRITGGPDLSGYTGPIDDRNGIHMGGVGMSFRGYDLNLFWSRTTRGDGYGFGALPLENTDEGKGRHWNLSLGRNWNIRSDLGADLRLDWQESDTEWPMHLITRKGGIIPGSPPPTVATADVLDQRGDRFKCFNAKLNLTWSGWERHQWLMGAHYSQMRIKDAWNNSNLLPGKVLGPVRRLTGELAWLPVDPTREITSLTLQDQIRLRDDLELTAGLRIDDYSDVGQNVSPRLAAVWRVKPQHILKFQYAQAFRPPTFSELYDANHGNSSLDPETLDTTEVGYIHRKPGRVTRLTLFHTRYEDMIQQSGSPPTYTNVDTVRTRGVELEWQEEISSRLNISMNLSYLADRSNDTQDALVGASRWMGNTVLRVKPFTDLTVSTRLHFVSKRLRHQELQDTQSEVPGYATIDLGLSQTNLLRKGLTLKGGVRNLLDKEILVSRSNPTVHDIRLPGRTWWLQLAQKF